ncbi:MULTISPECIES: hypothetical protein [unclassified Microcoleus]|uniref:hypothetical protein n=1 Tax=unclassified Microcoleus TaxID=2642155 RepID=UPI002FD27029
MSSRALPKPSKRIATLVKIMESLPEILQDRVVQHLREYILKSNNQQLSECLIYAN